MNLSPNREVALRCLFQNRLTHTVRTKLMHSLAVVVLAASVINAGAAARLTNSPPVNGQVTVVWSSRGALEMADQVSGPWLTITNAANPYTNPITTGSRFFRLNQTVDATTLHKKVMCGYQGWFRCPGDGANSWFHWSSSQSQITTNTLTFEMWPDMSDYLPVIYPGFSWDNLQKLAPGTSKIDRLGGDFLWQQFYAVKNLGLDWAFVGMFDEVDEGTAIFKVSNTPPTQAYFVTYDGLPADWYLRLTAEGTKVLTGERASTPDIPISP